MYRLRADRLRNSARAPRYGQLDRSIIDGAQGLCVQLPGPLALSQLARRERPSEEKLAPSPRLREDEEAFEDPQHDERDTRRP